jgi:YHS domain-containing protein
MYRIIIWALLVILVVRVLMRLGRGILEGAGYSRNGQSRQSVPLVKDPVCGIFVPRTKALTSGSGSDMKFFCSEKCRKEWARR